MCCQRVRRGRKATCDNPDARGPATAFNDCDGMQNDAKVIFPWMCRDVVGANIVDPTAWGRFIRRATYRGQEGCWDSHDSNKFNAASAASFNPKSIQPNSILLWTDSAARNRSALPARQCVQRRKTPVPAGPKFGLGAKTRALTAAG